MISPAVYAAQCDRFDLIGIAKLKERDSEMLDYKERLKVFSLKEDLNIRRETSL